MFSTALPMIMLAYLVVVVAALATLRRLSTQWRQHAVEKASRVRELLALALVTGVALLLIAYAQGYFQDRTDRQQLQAELQVRDRQAKELRARIAGELDAVRAMLADRTVRSIERNTLADARKELARFVELKDPRIVQMLGMIDNELEIRDLVRQALAESAPDKLHALYTRLTALAPDKAEYKDQAARYAALAQAPAAPAKSTVNK